VRTDQEQNLVVSPYELRMVHGEWYLLGYTSLCGQVRVFAVSRIRQLELSQQKFRMPRRHVMETHFAQAWKTFEDTEPFLPLKVRFAYSVADLVRQTRGTRFDSMELQPDGSLICTGKVASLREWTWWLLAFGPAAEVLAPQRLRAEMARSAQEMHLRYAELEGP
jgi:predicted DNA-binding transcriptional regulator YafY